MSEWTREIVEERLIEAADVMKRLPNVRVAGFFSTWPAKRQEFSDLVGQEPQPMRRPAPARDAIDRTEVALPWLQWLEAEDAKLVWMRAEGTPWKAVCWRFGIARLTAHRRYAYALSLIAWRLNGRRVPAKRSRRFVIQSTQRVSSPK